MSNEVWKEFAAHEVTHSVAHYLTTIQELRQLKGYAIKQAPSSACNIIRKPLPAPMIPKRFFRIFVTIFRPPKPLTSPK